MIDRLTLYPFDPFVFKLGFNSLTIGSPKMFYDLVQCFTPNTVQNSTKQDESETQTYKGILSFKETPVQAKKECIFLGDIVQNPDLNRLFLKPILFDTAKHLDEDDYQQLLSAYSIIRRVCDRVCLTAACPLEVTAAFDPLILLDVLKPHFIQSDIRSVYDGMQTILDIAGALHLEKTLVTLHLIQECSCDQINYLVNETKRLNLQLVDIELRNSPVHLKDGENHFVDKDLVCLS